MNAEKSIKKIAVFRALKLGDLLCSMPAIANVRQAYPNAEITLIGMKSAEEICRRYAAIVDRLLVFPGHPDLPEQKYKPKEFQAFLNQTRREGFDLLLQMHGNGSIVNTLCSQFQAKRMAGFYPKGKELPPEGQFIPYPDFGHESDRHLTLIKALGIEIKIKELFFPLTEKDLFEFLSLPVNSKNTPYICIHPGSADPIRRWPMEYFSQSGKILMERGFRILITGSKSEYRLAENLRKSLGQQAINLAGKTTLGCLGVLLKQSQGLVSNCTGVSHLAAALKVPSLVISMDREPLRWGPKNRHLHQVIDWTKNQDFTRCQKVLFKHFRGYLLDCSSSGGI